MIARNSFVLSHCTGRNHRPSVVVPGTKSSYSKLQPIYSVTSCSHNISNKHHQQECSNMTKRTLLCASTLHCNLHDASSPLVVSLVHIMIPRNNGYINLRHPAVYAWRSASRSELFQLTGHLRCTIDRRNSEGYSVVATRVTQSYGTFLEDPDCVPPGYSLIAQGIIKWASCLRHHGPCLRYLSSYVLKHDYHRPTLSTHRPTAQTINWVHGYFTPQQGSAGHLLFSIVRPACVLPTLGSRRRVLKAPAQDGGVYKLLTICSETHSFCQPESDHTLDTLGRSAPSPPSWCHFRQSEPRSTNPHPSPPPNASTIFDCLSRALLQAHLVLRFHRDTVASGLARLRWAIL